MVVKALATPAERRVVNPERPPRAVESRRSSTSAKAGEAVRRAGAVPAASAAFFLSGPSRAVWVLALQRKTRLLAARCL
jgi:hypothetical protein